MSDQHSDVQIQNLLTSITDALLTGQTDMDQLEELQRDSSNDIKSLLHIIDQLEHVFISVQPSPHFVKRLRADLTGMDNSNMLIRVRRLPPRVQIAAGLALVAGFVILSRRRTNSDPVQEVQEAAIAQ